MKLDKALKSNSENDRLKHFAKYRGSKCSGNAADVIVLNDSKTFIYELTQLQDANTSRKNSFWEDMQQFLGFKNAAKEFTIFNSYSGHKILSNFQLDIYHDKHDKACKLLIQNANCTAR